MKIGSLFSGYGGLDLGVQAVLGGEVAWHVEFDAAPSKILAHHWPDVPNYGDITALDFTQVEPVDVLTGGFPCQDLSLAGRRAGMRPGTRSGLWADFLRGIATLRPKLAVIENVRGLLSGCAESDLEPCPGCVGDGEHRPPLRALGRVLGDLAGVGYDAEWVGVRASDAGAPHGRFRVFVAAYPAGVGYGDSGPSSVGGVSTSAVAGDIREGAGSPDAAHDRHERSGGARLGRAGLADGCESLADSYDEGRECLGWVESEQRDVDGRDGEDVAWGAYEPAIRRWEAVTGRDAPAPTVGGRLSPAFVEWMMGLPKGHVTGVGISRAHQLKALGNGVVPQQAALALSVLLSHSSERSA